MKRPARKLWVWAAVLLPWASFAQKVVTIPIEMRNTALALQTDELKRVGIAYFGRKLAQAKATYFDFDEQKLTGLFQGAKQLGVDMFLLDDGWFGNKYPRDNDRAGLGDWQENRQKLPHGIGYLVREAEKAGVKFGIWVEPEMVNPKSDLYERHPEWVIREPERPEKYFRNQLVLDLSNRFEPAYSVQPVRLKGLDPRKEYRVRELNLCPGTRSAIDEEAVYSGDFLMTVGLNPVVDMRRRSVILEVFKVN